MEFEKNTNGLIDKLIYMNETDVKREDILARLDSIALLEGEERDRAVGDYFLSLFKHVYRDALTYREMAANDVSILKEDQELRLMDARPILSDVSRVFESYFADKNIKPCEGKFYFGIDPVAIRDTVCDVCNETMAMDTYTTAGQARKIDLLNDMRLALDQLASRRHQYSGEHFTSNDLVEEIYILHEERAAQFAKRSFLSKLLHPVESIKTMYFLSKTEKALKLVGFDKETHGPAVKERLAKEPSSIRRNQIANAKDDCKARQEEIRLAEWRKENPILNVARDKLNKAKEEFANEEHPEHTFKIKVDHILKKYDLSPEKEKEFTKVNLNYDTMATEFDFYRNQDLYRGHRDAQFLDVCRAFVDSALRKDEPIDIKQILRDANEFVVTEFQTFSVMYERDEMKDLAKNGMVPRDAKLNYLKKKVLNDASKKCDAAELERIGNDIDEFANDFFNNREQYYEQEMRMLEGANSVKEPLSVDLNEPRNDLARSEPVKEAPHIEKEPVQMQ